MPDPLKPGQTDQDQDQPKPLAAEHLKATVTLKRKGEDKTMTVEELIARGQKEWHGETLAQEARELQQELEMDSKIATDMRNALKERDDTKLRRAFKNAGYSDEMLDAMFGTGQPTDRDDRDRDKSHQRRPDRSKHEDDQLDLDDDDTEVDPELAAALREIKRLGEKVDKLTDEREAEKKVKKQKAAEQVVDNALDSDDDLARIVTQLPDGLRKKFRKMAYAHVAEAMETEPRGPRATKQGLKALKEFVETLAKAVGGTSEEDEDETPGTGVPGFGPASSSASQIHHTPSADRVSARDESGKYEESVNKRLQRYIKAFRRSK